jgi:rubrerythrin
MRIWEKIKRFFKGGKAEEKAGRAAEEPEAPTADERELLPCPVCGALCLEEKGAYEICPVCGWEDDPLQRREPNFAGGANKMSLNEAKRVWTEKGSVK